MRVVTLKKGTRWTVRALCNADDPDTCQILDYLASLDLKARADVLDDLKDTIPNNSQELWGRVELSKSLGNDWYEFRWNGRLGARRILFFFEPGQIVLCAHGVTKKKDKIPRYEMAAAEERRKRYKEEKKLGLVKLEDEELLEDDDGSEEMT
jgi:phage-related protein